MIKEKEWFEINPSELTLSSMSGARPDLGLPETGILMLPSSPEHGAFFSGTLEIRDYFREKNPEMPIHIFANDDEYKELALHSADFWIGTFLVGSVIVPIFVNIISSYLYDELKAKDGDHVSIDVIVERKDGKSSSVSYRGDVKDFGKVIESVKKLADE
ncbi:MAG TPA: hypothetical protein VFW42_09470 [Fluviicoccus sp.]|nr:hypothetical protein [Fluviicoccus sp.]